QARMLRERRVVLTVEPLAHRRELGLHPARQLDGLGRRAADEARGARDAVGEHVRAKAAGLGDGPRAAVQRRREPALGVRERHVDRVLVAPVLDDLAVGLPQLVAAELELERADHGDRDHGRAGQHLLGPRERLEVDRGHLAVELGQLLAGLDRLVVVLPRPPAHLHLSNLKLHVVTTTENVIDQEREEREAFAGVLRFYELAKRQEWQVRDLPWGEMPPIPEGKGSDVRKARRRDMWRSVLTQQLQADMLACEMASQLLNIAPDPEAKLYYSTMVQDESRHTEAWLKLIEEAGGTAERDPHLDELAHMTLEADSLEEKVFQMQVFYERLIISRFRLIARASRGTVLEDLCNRLTTDDGIHHGAGMAYEKVLLRNADKKTKTALVDAANRLLPTFVEHALWR